MPSEQGSWQSFYAQFGAALGSDGAGPVPAAQAVAVVDVIDAARLSAVEHRVVGVNEDATEPAGTP